MFTVFPREGEVTAYIFNRAAWWKQAQRWVSDVRDGRFSSLPALVNVPGVARVAITEADLLDYPRIWELALPGRRSPELDALPVEPAAPLGRRQCEVHAGLPSAPLMLAVQEASTSLTTASGIGT